MTDTLARGAANQAGAHVNKNAYDEAQDFLPLKGIDHVEFWVGNARQAAHYFRAAVGLHADRLCGPRDGRPRSDELRHAPERHHDRPDRRPFARRRDRRARPSRMATALRTSPSPSTTPPASFARRRPAARARDRAGRARRRRGRRAAAVGRPHLWRGPPLLHRPERLPRRLRAGLPQDQEAGARPPGPEPPRDRPLRRQRRARRHEQVRRLLPRRLRLRPADPLRRQGHPHRVQRPDVEGHDQRQRPGEVPDQRAGGRQEEEPDPGVPRLLPRRRDPAHRPPDRGHRRDGPASSARTASSSSACPTPTTSSSPTGSATSACRSRRSRSSASRPTATRRATSSRSSPGRSRTARRSSSRSSSGTGRAASGSATSRRFRGDRDRAGAAREPRTRRGSRPPPTRSRRLLWTVLAIRPDGCRAGLDSARAPGGRAHRGRLPAMYQWLVFVHLAGLVLFLLMHGVSMWAAFGVRRDPRPETARLLLGLSLRANGVMYIGLLAADRRRARRRRGTRTSSPPAGSSRRYVVLLAVIVAMYAMGLQPLRSRCARRSRARTARRSTPPSSPAGSTTAGRRRSRSSGSAGC